MADIDEAGKRPKELTAKVIENLIKMIDGMSPFLDCSGTAYCNVKPDEGGDDVIFTLRDRRVRACLIYRYHRLHEAHPGRERVNEAIEYVEGRLLATTPPKSSLKDCPIFRCLARAILDEESGAGSASDILTLLRETAKTHKLLQGKEKLPKTATAMGKWLARNQLRLRSFGIDLSRPPRGSKKRLWDWQVVLAGDGRDTLPRNLSQAQQDGLPQANKANTAPTDAMTNETLNDLLGESLDDNAD
jgi:hypothetical protein